METLLSVIVPVYNTQDYLVDCIESILKQSFTEYELILVDDGSTDNSGKICDEYKSKDPRIKVFHKINGGLSSARNYGLKHASGAFISFIDSDDYISPDAYSVMMNNFDDSIDIVCCGRYRDRSGVLMEEQTLKKTRLFSRECAIKEVLTRGVIDVSACDKIFRSSVISEVLFEEGIINEDVIFTFNAFINSRRIFHVGVPLYYYRVREKSTTFSLTYSNKTKVYYYNLQKLEILLKEHCLFKKGNFSVYAAYVYQLLITMIAISPNNDAMKADLRLYKKNFRKCILAFLLCSNISFKNKVMSIIISLNLYNFYLKIRG